MDYSQFSKTFSNRFTDTDFDKYSPRKKKRKVHHYKSRNFGSFSEKSKTLQSDFTSNGIFQSFESTQITFSPSTNRNFPKRKILHSSIHHLTNNKPVILTKRPNVHEIKINNYTLKTPLPFIRKADKDINILLTRKNHHNKSCSLDSLSTKVNGKDFIMQYSQCLETVSNAPILIIEKVKQKNSEKIKNFISDNRFINLIIQNLIRKVEFINTKNEKISNGDIMNLLTEELNELKESVDKIIRNNCNIKSFSKVVKNYSELKNSNIFLPLINSIDSFFIRKNKESFITEKKEENTISDITNEYNLNTKLKAINEEKMYLKQELNNSKSSNTNQYEDKSNRTKNNKIVHNQNNHFNIYEKMIQNSKTKKDKEKEKAHFKEKSTKNEKEIKSTKIIKSHSHHNFTCLFEKMEMLSLNNTGILLSSNTIKSKKDIFSQNNIEKMISTLVTSNTIMDMRSKAQYYSYNQSNKSENLTPGTETTFHQTATSNYNTASNWEHTNSTNNTLVKTNHNQPPKNIKGISSMNKKLDFPSTLHLKPKQAIKIVKEEENNKKKEISKKKFNKKIKITNHKNDMKETKLEKEEKIKQDDQNNKTKFLNSINILNLDFQKEKHLTIETDNAHISSSSSKVRKDTQPKEDQKDLTQRTNTKRQTLKKVTFISQTEEENEKENVLSEIENEFVNNLISIAGNEASSENIDILSENEEILRQIKQLREKLQLTGYGNLTTLSNRELLRFLLIEKNRLNSQMLMETKKNLTSILDQIGAEKNAQKELLQLHRRKTIRNISQKKSNIYFRETNQKPSLKLNIDQSKRATSENFFQSFKSKINELNLNQEIRYQLTFKQSEESKTKFLDFISKIEEMKKLDNDSYIKSLEDNYGAIIGEIGDLVEARQAEERINKFLNSFVIERQLKKNRRKHMQDHYYLIDHKVEFMVDKDDVNKCT